MEQELKIKDKIVKELVERFSMNGLDWNMNHHVMKLKIDFLVMLRKLLLNIPLNQVIVPQSVVNKELSALDLARMRATQLRLSMPDFPLPKATPLVQYSPPRMAINEEELMMQHSRNMMELDVIHKKL